MIQSLLVANRGEIADRIFRTARKMGIKTVAVATEADRSWPYWRSADRAIFIGEGPVAESYLSIPTIIDAAKTAGVDAIHPGYGFLSENAAFAEACAEAGLVFIGPPAAAIRAMGSKADAKALMARAGVPIVPGYHGERQDHDFLKKKAYEIGYPVMIKAVAGGGGRGMRLVEKARGFDEALESARREAKNSFGDDRVLIEKFVANPRHIEVQVFADIQGHVVHFGERDCSIQRRHQKVVEEAPAPGMSPAVREAIGSAAIAAAKAVNYVGAGTVEFIADSSKGLTEDGFFFMEMNTRLQVEHPVTEMVANIDLVELQLRIASGEPLPISQEEVALKGHAIEVRLYAEDPANGFAPGTGKIWLADFPDPPVRVDTGIETGSEVGPFYDSMLAKVIVHSDNRDSAVKALGHAIDETWVAGPKTNLAFLSAIVGHSEFVEGGTDTGFIARNEPELIDGGVSAAVLNEALRSYIEQQARSSGENAPGPWSDSTGFELTGLERVYDYRLNAEGSDRSAQLRWRNGEFSVALDDNCDASETHLPVRIVSAGSDILVLNNGHQARLRFPDPLDRTVDEGQASGMVSAPMHGKVAAVHMSEGDQVEKGVPILVLEAMKMEHTIGAPISGTIVKVLVEPNQQIAEGAQMLVISATPEN